MPYLPNIPAPTDIISQSQSQIQGNFQAIQALVDINHVDFASGDQGKHTMVEFVNQAVVPTFLATEVGFYNKVSTLTTVNELWFKRNGNAGVTGVPVSASQQATAGWLYHVNAMLEKWGTVSPGGAGTFAFPFPVGAQIPVFVNAFNIVITPQANTTIFVSALTNVDFTYTTSGAGDFYYRVLGN